MSNVIILSRRSQLPDPINGTHAGLLLSRYLKIQESSDKKEQTADEKERTINKKERTALFEYAKNATKSVIQLYKTAFDRWKKFVTENCVARELPIDQRMIIGLGGENVLETGLTLHHTYGVPYIPGSALKGLCAHWFADFLVTKNNDSRLAESELDKLSTKDCEKLIAEVYDEVRKNSDYVAIFGNTSKAGMIQFYDAFILPKSLEDGCLCDDVMTPHHSEYYSSNGEVAPTEYDLPVPITFLSVKGTFLVALSSDEKDNNGNITSTGNKWLDYVWKILKNALTQNGIGGKTNSGYGFGTLKKLAHPPVKQLKTGDQVLLKRIRKEKGDLLFETSDGKFAVILKDDQPAAKKISIGESVEMTYRGPLGDKLQFELTSELRERLK
jgi:CRISPR type III-B/RAMP module RAMP protein Cmr6